MAVKTRIKQNYYEVTFLALSSFNSSQILTSMLNPTNGNGFMTCIAYLFQ